MYDQLESFPRSISGYLLPRPVDDYASYVASSTRNKRFDELSHARLLMASSL